MTLVEVVIAIAIVAFVSMTMYSSAIYTTRQTIHNVDHLYALQVLNSATAKVRTARYNKLTKASEDVGANEYEKQFFSPQTINSDSKNPNSTAYTLTYEMKGFGKGITAGGGGSGSYVLSLPKESGDWKADDFKGRLLVVTGGSGVNQVMYIKSNAASQGNQGSAKTVAVQLTKNLDGTGSVDWPVAVGSSSIFAVDYGLYCETVVTWDGGAGYKTITETAYVPTTQK